MSDILGDDRLRRLIAAGQSLVSDLDLDRLLTRLLDLARALTSARYAAIGVLDEERHGIDRFITQGVDAETHRAVGDPPRGRGILGLLIEDPRPLRLHDLREHPRSYGFPAGHPPMRSFLGVPVLVRGSPWGNLYLTEKQGGDFDGADEQTAVILAAWAGLAIEHAALYQRLGERRDVLERVARNYETTTEITRAVGAETDLHDVLELIVKRGRALVDAREMLILLRERDDLVIAACAGEVDAAVRGRRIPVEGSTASAVLRALRPERIRDVAARLRIASGRLGVPLTSNRLGIEDPQAALLVPLEFRGRRLGVLVAFDRIGADVAFDADQQTLLLAFAASAATAVATAQSVERQRVRDVMTAAERERRRWARELHDETLQGLAGLRVRIDAALEAGDPTAAASELGELGERVDREVSHLRSLIADLRPVVLDDRGLGPAIEDLALDVSTTHGLRVDADVGIHEPEGSIERLDPELETTIYRIVQEALTNAVRHAHAGRVAIGVVPRDGGVEVTVSDDGAGFDPHAPREGWGIPGMHERVELADGTLAIESAPGAGTTVRAWLRLDGRGDPQAGGQAAGSSSRCSSA